MFNHLEGYESVQLPTQTINGKRYYETPEGKHYPSVTTVTGICEGLLSFNKEDVTDFSIINTQLQKTDNNERLFVPLPKKNVASADLTDSSLIVREQWDNVTITISSDGKGSTQTFQTSDIGPNLTFLPFDKETFPVVPVPQNGSRMRPSSGQARLIMARASFGSRLMGLKNGRFGAVLCAQSSPS